MGFSAHNEILAIVLLLAGAILGYVIFQWRHRAETKKLTEKKQTILDQARNEADSIVREARLVANEEAVKLRQQAESSFAQRRQMIEESERRVAERERLVNERLENLVQEDKKLRQQQAEYDAKARELANEKESLHKLEKERRDELARIGNLTEEEAKQTLLKEIEQSTLKDATTLSRRIIDETKQKAEDQAKRILSIALQRYAGEYTFENTSGTVALPNEEIKGRIIGREGRNIRTFENATGITVLIDDTPNAVILSGFDPVRREIARETMERLIADGRIHPTRIEEVVQQVTEEMDDTIVKAGEEAIARVGLTPMPMEVTKLLGRLRFRISYSQNILDHSIEVAHLCGLLAGEIGVNTTHAKQAGLLHDVGKALNHEMEGPHAVVGADFIHRHGIPEEVVNGVASHHNEGPQQGLLGVLVATADTISAARPGARSETMATYIKRLESLEKLGNSFPGVEKSYALQAGRELRVLVRSDEVTDAQAYVLARDIARKVEEELHYPGQIRVTVLRETRCIEYAK